MDENISAPEQEHQPDQRLFSQHHLLSDIKNWGIKEQVLP